MTVNRQVLVCDDEPEVVRGILSQLQPWGVEVLWAATGREALSQLAVTDIDLVLFDVTLPGEPAYEILRKIRQNPRYECLPVIMMTAEQPTDQEVYDCFHFGGDMYIVKPIEVETLRPFFGGF
jgi:DNA-binding response OmpR family regulator